LKDLRPPSIPTFSPRKSKISKPLSDNSAKSLLIYAARWQQRMRNFGIVATTLFWSSNLLGTFHCNTECTRDFCISSPGKVVKMELMDKHHL
jgi:hypothetical protein